MAFPTGWQRKVAITIDQTLCGSSDSTDFTVLLTRDNLPDEMCSPTDGNRAQSDGGDVRFSSDSDGNTQLALHVEGFEHDTSDAAGDADIRLNVKVPTLDTSSDTVIYAWYSTGGTTSQPSSDDTYGSQNAYDSDHCHVYTLDEDPTDTPPEYKDVVGGRDLTETGGTAVSAAGKNGGAALDPNAVAVGFGDYSGFIVPDDSGGNPATNTGACYIPGDDRIAIANFDDTGVIEMNKTTGAEITSFTLTEGETLVQGVAYDSVADQFFFAFAGTSTLRVYDRDGTYDRTLAGSTNSVAYDFADDAIWISPTSGQARQIHKTTGATNSTITFTGDASGIAVEGITHNNTDDTLYVTTDTGNMVYEINKSTGATIQSFRGPAAIEHPAYDHTDDILWVNGDGRYHIPGTGENVIYKLTPDGEPWSWKAPTDEYTVEMWVYPDSVSGTHILWGNWAGVQAAAFYQEFQNSGGTLRAYDTSVGLLTGGTITASTWQHVVLRYTDSSSTLHILKNASITATKTSAVGDFGPDGRLGVGGRPNDTFNFNGRIDDVRFHRVSRSADWLTARYNNSNDPATFATAGTPEDSGTAITGSPWNYYAQQTAVTG